MSMEPEFEIAHRKNITRLKGKTDSLVGCQHTAHHHVAIALRVQSVGSVLLQYASQRKPDRFGQPRLECFVLEKVDLNGARSCRGAVGGTEPVTRASAKAGASQDSREAAPSGQ